MDLTNIGVFFSTATSNVDFTKDGATTTLYLGSGNTTGTYEKTLALAFAITKPTNIKFRVSGIYTGDYGSAAKSLKWKILKFGGYAASSTSGYYNIYLGSSTSGDKATEAIIAADTANTLESGTISVAASSNLEYITTTANILPAGNYLLAVIPNDNNYRLIQNARIYAIEAGSTDIVMGDKYSRRAADDVNYWYTNLTESSQNNAFGIDNSAHAVVMWQFTLSKAGKIFFYITNVTKSGSNVKKDFWWRIVPAPKAFGAISNNVRPLYYDTDSTIPMTIGQMVSDADNDKDDYPNYDILASSEYITIEPAQYIEIKIEPTTVIPAGEYMLVIYSKDDLNAGSSRYYSQPSIIPVFMPSNLCHIYNGSSWIDAEPYVYNGSSWISCQPYVYSGSSWSTCT